MIISPLQKNIEPYELSPGLVRVAQERTAHLERYVLKSSIQDLLVNAYMQGLEDMTMVLEEKT